MAFVVPHIDGQKGVHGDGNGGGVKKGGRTNTPNAKAGQKKRHHLPLGHDSCKNCLQKASPSTCYPVSCIRNHCTGKVPRGFTIALLRNQKGRVGLSSRKSHPSRSRQGHLNCGTSHKHGFPRNERI